MRNWTKIKVLRVYVDLHVLVDLGNEYDLHGDTLFPKHYPLIPPIYNGMGHLHLYEKQLGILKEKIACFVVASNGNIHHNVGFKHVPITIFLSLV